MVLSAPLTQGLAVVCLDNTHAMTCICLTMTKGEGSFCLEPLCRLPVMHLTVWFNTLSVIKLFSFSATFVESFSELGRGFVFNYSFPTGAHS